MNGYFQKQITPADVVWTYAGVRPLVDDGSGKPEAATRGYRLELSEPEEGAPVLSVYGGKITSYRHLAEEAMDILAGRMPAISGDAWTAGEPLRAAISRLTAWTGCRRSSRRITRFFQIRTACESHGPMARVHRAGLARRDHGMTLADVSAQG